MRTGSATRGSKPATSKRPRAPARNQAPAFVPQAAADWNIASRARSLALEGGLNLVIVGRSDAAIAADAGFALPATQISVAPNQFDEPIAIISASDKTPGWLDAEGGTVVVKVPPGGGSALVTVYGLAEDAAPPPVQVVNLQDTANIGRVAAPAAGGAGPVVREIDAELVLHIERQGDRRLSARGWAGNPGQPLRIEGFAIRPLEMLNPGDMEYMAFGLGGRQTPWVTDGKLCGTRGRGLPLTGFAVRLAQGASDRFDVIYEGYFFRSGISGPVRNGEPCLPSMSDDSLAAIRLRVVGRPGA